MATKDDDDVEILSSNDSQGWGEVLSINGELARGVIGPVADHQQQRPEVRLLDSLGGGGYDSAAVEHKGPGAIQAYQLALPLSGIGCVAD